MKARTWGEKGRHLWPRLVQKKTAEGKTSDESWKVKVMMKKKKKVVRDGILQLVDATSLPDWYDTAVRTFSNLFALFHRDAFLLQPIFVTTGRI